MLHSFCVAPAQRLVFRSLLLLISVLSGLPPAHAQTRYALPPTEASPPVALLTQGRTQYYITEKGVYELAGRRLLRRYQSPYPITCALATDTALCLGTRQGALSLGWQRWQARPLALPAEAAAAPIVALLRAPDGDLWVGAAGYGTYRGRPGRFEPVLRIPGLSAGVATPTAPCGWAPTWACTATTAAAGRATTRRAWPTSRYPTTWWKSCCPTTPALPGW
ncbi:MAG: hypothetical protein WKG07_25825 [Hymenobacter sp.]